MLYHIISYHIILYYSNYAPAGGGGRAQGDGGADAPGQASTFRTGGCSGNRVY